MFSAEYKSIIEILQKDCCLFLILHIIHLLFLKKSVFNVLKYSNCGRKILNIKNTREDEHYILIGIFPSGIHYDELDVFCIKPQSG